MWVAAGLALGVGAENWANFWGIVFYLASIALLAVHQYEVTGRPGSRAWILPLAALGAALHPDWAAFATGGLETSLFTFLLLCGYLLVLRGLSSVSTLAGAGFVFALASLTRPDGLLPALAAGVFIVGVARPHAVRVSWKAVESGISSCVPRGRARASTRSMRMVARSPGRRVS